MAYLIFALLIGEVLILIALRKTNHLLKGILMKAAEAIEQLTEANTTLVKIGTETQKLLDLIGTLENNPDLPAALADQITAIKAQATVVDNLVPDAPPPQP